MESVREITRHFGLTRNESLPEVPTQEDRFDLMNPNRVAIDWSYKVGVYPIVVGSLAKALRKAYEETIGESLYG